MENLVIYISYMCCYRCIVCVKNILKDLEIDFEWVKLGEVRLCAELTAGQRKALAEELSGIGLELIDCGKGLTIEKIKIFLHRWLDSTRE